jgi:hypothetical protein
MQTVAEVVADVEPNSRWRITRVVHEAVLTMRFQMARERPRPGRAAWPDYVYERDDHGDRPAIEELRALVLPFQPTSRHFDAMDWVYLDCFGKWPNPRSGKNGLERWQWLLLELRAWQTTCGLRGGWRSIAEAIRSRPGLPKFSHEWARIEHERLIDVAVALARKEGRV